MRFSDMPGARSLKTGAVRGRRERDIVKPAGIRGAADGQAGVDEQPRAQEQPEGQRVHARERHVPRPDHQRQQVVAERPRRHRDDEEEDHRDPMHRHQLVVGVRAEHVLVGAQELRAHQQRLDPAGREEHQRREEVKDPDPLVIGRRHPAQGPGAGRPYAPQPVEVLLRSGRRGHA
jgi:hypothetical protein